MILRLFVSCILILTGLHTSVLYKMSIWLRVSEHISFKLVVMSYRSIHGTSPSYLQSCFTRVSDMTSIRRLRSSTSHRLGVPPVRLSTVGRRAFPVSGATVWKRPASPRRICAVTRGFQTTTQDISVSPFLARHYLTTRVTINILLVFIYWWMVSGHLWSLQ